ncbi:beta-eliminating lyase-related protein [Chloroflexota bacterium]
MKIIELRNDTKTLLTEEMRRVIYEAEVGDDAAREDPTVNRLEELAVLSIKQAIVVETIEEVPYVAISGRWCCSDKRKGCCPSSS